MTIHVADEPVPPLGAQGAVRAALVATFRRLVRVYFREVERLGPAPGPDVRGRVFVANHANALIDPVLVLTDAACPIAPVAKSTLWQVPGLGWLLDAAGAVPIVRRQDAPGKDAAANDAVFARVAEHLARGGNILIFPEGISHSGSRLAPLRTGAARMLVQAAARGGVAPTFQAVGLEFDDPTDFRSRCLLLWGPVRTLAEVTAATTDADARIAAITARMRADLEELLVEGETPADRHRIAQVAALLATDAGDPTLAGWSDRARAVEDAARTLRTLAPDVVAHVSAVVDAYLAALDRAGTTDAHVAGVPAPAPPARPWWRRALHAPLAVAGLALYALPYRLPRLLARRADPDAVSTYKLGAGLVIYPAWAALLIAGAAALLPLPLVPLAVAVILASPFAALAWMDAYYQRRPDLDSATLARLRLLRDRAVAAVADARARL